MAGLADSCFYHYTSAEGVHGIVTQGEMRATHLSYMNDYNELQLAFSLAAGMLGSPTFRERWPQYEAGIEAFVEYCNTTRIRSNIFAVSFTSNPDLLSQWRGYGGVGGGYSLGFDREALTSLAAARGWRFEACLYGMAEQERALVGALDHFFQRHDRQEFSHISPEDPVQRVSRTALGPVLHLAPLFKAEAFREEGERRLISPLVAIGTTPMDVHHRISGGQLVPYVNFPLPRRGGRLWIPDTRIGPGHDAEGAGQGIWSFYLSQGVDYQQTMNSVATVRR